MKIGVGCFEFMRIGNPREDLLGTNSLQEPSYAPRLFFTLRCSPSSNTCRSSCRLVEYAKKMDLGWVGGGGRRIGIGPLGFNFGGQQASGCAIAFLRLRPAKASSWEHKEGMKRVSTRAEM